MGELANALLRLGKSMEQSADLPPLSAPPVWTDSKQRRREKLKKLTMGHRLDDYGSQDFGMGGMSM